MQQNIEQTISLLAQTPATLDALLRNLGEAWTMQDEGGETFTAFDVMGHLNHCERVDWMPRAKIILERGESQIFEPLDRRAQKQESQGKSLAQLLDEFAQLRAENVRQLRMLKLSREDLERRGTHPALGSVTLSQLLAAWAVHDLTHLHQVSRILAHQYREAVGPWSAYLGVLRCNGRSV